MTLLLGIALLLSAAVVIFVHDDGVEVKLVVTDDGAEDGEYLKGVQCTNASGPPYKPPRRHAARLKAVQRHTASEPHTEDKERKHSADETRRVLYILSLTRTNNDGLLLLLSCLLLGLIFIHSLAGVLR